MRKIIAFIFFFLLTVQYLFAGMPDTTGDNKGIRFESRLSWQQISDKAKKENKLIFVDCFATWCAPCKFMSEKIFTQPEAGDYMNSRFICVAIQMDRTKKDNNEVKNWYDIADSIANKYSIDTYPTYLFFSADGQAIHRIVGSTGNQVSDFIKAAGDALDANKQYYTQLSEYHKHLNDSTYLRKALKKALSTGDKENAEAIADAYVVSENMDFNKIDIGLICSATRSSRDKGFRLLIDHAEKIDSMYKRPHGVEFLIYSILQKEEVLPLFSTTDSVISWSEFYQKITEEYPKLNAATLRYLNFAFCNQVSKREITPIYQDSTKFADWNQISARIRRLYPGFDGDSMIAYQKIRYDYFRGLWTECGSAAIAYLDNYGNHVNPTDMNGILWDFLFMRCKNKSLLRRALVWARRLVDSSQSLPNTERVRYAFLDTYANLLYVTGSRKQAIIWEKKALEGADQYATAIKQTTCKITIERMQRGQSTSEGRTKADEYQ